MTIYDNNKINNKKKNYKKDQLIYLKIQLKK